MSFVIARDPHDRDAARAMLDRAVAPLLRDGARIERVLDQPGLSVAMVRWKDAAAPRASDSRSPIILIDGYTFSSPDEPAALRDIFQRQGAAAFESLDGSYLLCAIDTAAPRIDVFTDCGGTRSLFYGSRGGRTLVAPSLKCFVGEAELRGAIAPAAVLSLLLNAYLFDDLTYFENVRTLGPAARLSISGDEATVTRYWTPPFGAASNVDEARFEADVTRAVDEHCKRFSTPLIGLSGGVDSRLMLAAARRAGRSLPCVTWSYLEKEVPGSDEDVAARLAAKVGAKHARHALDYRALTDEAPRLVAAADGLVGHLGAYADRQRLAVELAREHDAVLFGDQCYRGENECRTADEAVAGIGVAPLGSRGVGRLVKFLFQPDAAEACLRDYQARLDRLLASAGQHASAQDLHDRLYWQVRLPRLLAQPKSLWRRYLEPVSPFLSAPLLAHSAALPAADRVHKQFLRRMVQRMDPALATIPYAEVSARVKWRRVFAQRGAFQQSVSEQLTTSLASFDEWFKPEAVRAMLRASLGEKPRSGGWMNGWRAAFLKPLFAPPLILSLLTLKLWLSAAGHHRSSA